MIYPFIVTPYNFLWLHLLPPISAYALHPHTAQFLFCTGHLPSVCSPPLTTAHTPVILTYIIYLFYQHGHFSSSAGPEDTGNNLPINTASAKKMWTFSKSAATHLELRNLFMVCLMTFPVPQTISC